MGDQAPISTDDESMTAIYDRITDAVVALDEVGRVTGCNEGAERVFCQREADICGDLIWDVVPEAIGSTVKHEYERAMETQEPGSVELEIFDNWYEVRAYPSETGVTVVVCDTTDRSHRTERRRKREQALADAYEIVADPDRQFDNQIEALLSVVRRTIGVEYATLSCVNEAANEYLFEVVDAPTDADIEAGETAPLDATNCEHVVSTEKTLVLNDIESEAPELADRAGNAEWGIACYLGTPVTVGDEVYGTFCFYDMETHSETFTDWDVTFVELLGNWVSAELDRKRYQREIEASNERLEQFAYAASHDLQEPLRMISSYLTLIQQRYADSLDEDGAEFLAYAIDGADRMREMIDGLLAYSRIETQGDLVEPIELDSVLDSVLDDLQLRLDETETELSRDSLPRVEGDAEQLRQVFQNLLEYAITYSGDEPPKVSITADRAGAEWTISVSDEGVGIAADDTERVFEVFERLHSHEEHPGSGIGLALCRRIIERHGGEIWVESEPDQGTAFRFTLPAVSAIDG